MEGEVLISPTNRRYTLEKRLGAGGFGTVFRARDNDGQLYAIKIINLPNDKKGRFKAINNFKIETSALAYLSRAPNCQMYIICMYENFLVENKNIAVIVSELMDGDLDSLPPTDEEFISMLRQLLSGLVYLHSRNVSHRDIKEANILRKGNIFKFGDVGLACGAKGLPGIDTCYYGAGTTIYLSPRSFQRVYKSADVKDLQKEDIWMLGVTLFKLLYESFNCGDFYDPDDYYDYLSTLTQDDVNRQIALSKYVRHAKLPINAINNILSKMLQVDPAKRITAQQALDLANRLPG